MILDTNIYFILAADVGRVKIGRSNQVHQRLKDLQVGSPCSLVLLGTFTAEYTVETLLHERFAHWRIIGEWFEYTDQLKMFVYGMIRASDPPEAMPGLLRIALSEYDEETLRSGEEPRINTLQYGSSRISYKNSRR